MILSYRIIIQEEPSLSGSIQSLKKAAAILDLFTADEKYFGISDMARILKLPKPTVQSLVRTLEEIGYLEKDMASSKYMLGPLLFQLGMKYMTNMDVASMARIWLDRLSAQFRESASVGMFIGGKVMIVTCSEPENRYMVFPQVGSVIPLHASGIGKVLFAFMEEEKRSRILENCSFTKLTDRTIGTLKGYLAEIEKVREQGIGFDLQESVIGLSCISGPVFNNRGQCIAAISVSGNSFNIEKNRDEIISGVLHACSQMSLQLGYRRA